MKSSLNYLVVVTVLFSAPVMGNESGPQRLQEAFLRAILAGDAADIGQLYAADAINYTIDDMVIKGRAGIVESWARLFEGSEVTEAVIFDDTHEVHGDTAVAWGLWRMILRPKDGGESATIEGRFMDISRRIDGVWMYVVDHASVPLSPPAE